MKRPAGVLRFDRPLLKPQISQKCLRNPRKDKKKWCGQTKIKHLCVKTQLMSRWSQAVELSWVTSGQREEVIWWTVEGSAAKTSVQKCGCPHLTFLTSVILLTSDLIFPLPSPHPSPASALLDNTPSIWRWRTTHTCTVKQLLSGKELSSISCGSSFFFSLFVCLFFYLWMFVHLFFFLIPGCSFFTMYYIHQSWVERSRGGTLAWGSECDVSVAGLRPTSLKHTCMQTSNLTRAGEARMGYEGG